MAGVSFCFGLVWYIGLGLVALGACVMLLFFGKGVVEKKYASILTYGGTIAILSIALTFAVTARSLVLSLLGTDQSYASYSNPPQNVFECLTLFLYPTR